MKRKCLAVGIILLFIGVAVAPSINSTVVKASDDLVEVTSQACGIQGFGNTTVKLTKEQYQNLDQYLVKFRATLNQTTTRDEAVPIFKDAVVELNKYGLLPKGLSVEKAQKLVVGRFQNDGLMKIFEKVYPKNQKYLQYDVRNIFCLIYGGTTRTHFIGITLIPIRLFSGITLGFYTVDYGGFHYYTAWGNIQTIGLYGFQSWSGEMEGAIPFSIIGAFIFGLGVIGFTGIQILLGSNHFYVGFALWVDVDEFGN